MSGPLSNAEWLETDGLGGFAMGTVGGRRTRRYHGLLVAAVTPPSERVMLVSGFEAWVETPAGRFAISSQAYRSGVIHPDGESRLESFSFEPWPCWRFRLQDGMCVEQELFMPHEASAVCLRWRLIGESNKPDASARDHALARLIVRPLLAVRDYHCLQHENVDFQFDSEVTTMASGAARRVVWRPYLNRPAIVSWSNGDEQFEPTWYRQFFYADEEERGLDCLEDLAAPSVLTWDLSTSDAAWLLTTETRESAARLIAGEPLADSVQRLREQEAKRRGRFLNWQHRAADQFIVRRGSGQTIIAGYPWFTDWGRDTFVALRGLCLATGELPTAKSILLSWAGTISEGMLPNRFPDHGESPQFNSVDASLWFVIVCHEFFAACKLGRNELSDDELCVLREAMRQILEGYSRGTRFGIRLDDDGLIAAGEAGVQLTWMDAKVGSWVVTPRIGKPVEVQALWLNALWLELRRAKQQGDRETFARWTEPFERGLASFRERFWNEEAGCLFDVVDVDHQPRRVDALIRPNQIFAAGGLPFTLLEPDRARRVVDVVESRLWTPLGLRSLAPGSPGYAGRYLGSVWQRDAAYHQGTAWAWLLGSFVEAWVKTRDDPQAARETAFRQFIEPLLAHRYQAGLNHVSEIADGDEPQQPRGCPFQAWSLGELLRAKRICDDGRTVESPVYPARETQSSSSKGEGFLATDETRIEHG